MGVLQSYPVQPVSWGSPAGSRKFGRPSPTRPSLHSESNCTHWQVSGAMHLPPLLQSCAHTGTLQSAPSHPLSQ
eukprot:9074074-Prorocentrum_lima.AAC.1